MIPDPDTIARDSAATGFSAESLEKVHRLLSLLDSLNSHPFLKQRIALKGGTALNLFVLPLRPNEDEFLSRLNGSGEIRPELLATDGTMQALIRDHPGLRWKALNVKRHLGVSDEEVKQD